MHASKFVYHDHDYRLKFALTYTSVPMQYFPFIILKIDFVETKMQQ